MKQLIKNMCEKEMKTPEGKVNFFFGVMLIIVFGCLEGFNGIKEFIWTAIFHKVPTGNSDSVALLLCILGYLFVCVLIIFWADTYRKNNFID